MDNTRWLQIARGLYLPRGGVAPLHILCYQQYEKWTCHCLEYGILAKSAKSKDKARTKLTKRIRSAMRLAAGISRARPSAPPILWQTWRSLQMSADPMGDGGTALTKKL